MEIAKEIFTLQKTPLTLKTDKKAFACNAANIIIQALDEL